VIPASIAVTFNFRYGTALTAEGIQQKIVEDLQQHQLDYQLSWHYSGAPFLTQTGLLLAVAQQAIVDVCGYAPKLSTSGGTSDGRFIAATGAQVLECGVSNATIHKSNESVAIADLYQLVRIYHKMLQGLSIAHDVP
jgi:succinyl-diaminopimelate desuccinylase